MLYQIRGLQLKLITVLMFIFLGCKNESLKGNEKTISIQKSNSIKLSVSSEGTILKTLKNNEFKLDIETSFSNDTLDIIDYKEDIYSSPIILSQQLYFFKNDKLINHYKLPIKYVKKKTITKISLNALQTPLYKVCLTRTNDNDYYIVYGSDYCNGSDCPEFIGIYSMSGKMIYEGISTKKGKVSLKDILLKYKIKLDNSSQCIKTDDFW
jgi:hypothetical protein